jgi:hypothetical protein
MLQNVNLIILPIHSEKLEQLVSIYKITSRSDWCLFATVQLF